MRIGVFEHLAAHPTGNVGERYANVIEEVKLADELGYDVAWLAEGHFHPSHCILPAPLVLASALAARTQRIRLGTAASVVTLHHPVYVAEEAAMLDVLSNGRLEFGITRGAHPAAFKAFGVSLEDSRSRFTEACDVIRAAWTEPTVSFRGEYFNLANVSVVPKPLQLPHPPISVAGRTEATALFAAEKGLNLLVGALTSFMPHAFSAHVAAYREAWTAYRAKPCGSVSAIVVVSPYERSHPVRETVHRSLVSYFRVIGKSIDPQGIESQTGVMGDPSHCVEAIAALVAAAPIDDLVCCFNPGGLLSHADVAMSMQRFADDVIPAVRRM
ncbi:MAG: LLM class flavin-dependent oxidoreductase [Gammaproteobacteria bacterium]